MTDFSVRLKKYREKLKETDKKWTQKYVADKVDVARVTYTAYENGTKLPPFDTINRIADLFDVKTDYLMGRSDDPKETTDGELEKLLKDPDTQLMFNNWKGMTEEERKEAIKMINYIQYKKSKGD